MNYIAVSALVFNIVFIQFFLTQETEVILFYANCFGLGLVFGLLGSNKND